MKRCIESLFCSSILALVCTISASGQDAAPQNSPLEEQRSNAIKFFPVKLRSDVKSELQRTPTLSVEQAIENVVNNQLKTYSLILFGTSISGTKEDVDKAIHKLAAEVDEARVDKQVGSGSSTSGSTSLTSKGSVPAVLGFAVENGALERSVSGSTITFRGRPVQMVQALQSATFFDSYKKIEENGALGFLNRFSFAVSFDTTRGGANGTFTGSTNQLSSFSVHTDLWNQRDPRSKRFRERWDTLRSGVINDMTNRLYAVGDKVFDHPIYRERFEAWKKRFLPSIIEAYKKNDDAALAQATDDALKLFPPAGDIPGAVEILRNAADSTQSMLEARANILDLASKAPIIAFEYTDNRATKVTPPMVQLPDTSNVKGILEMAPFAGGSFTLNGSATIFNSRPMGFTGKRLRDLQISSQLDVPLNIKVAPKISNFVLSLSAKFDHIANDTLPIAAMSSSTTTMASATTAALKGNLAIGQVKLTIPVKNSGVKIPIK